MSESLHERPPVGMNNRYDVIIIGGGIIGCALADELARRGRRVVILERGHVGAEASSAAAGILSAQMDLPAPGPLFDLCQASRRLYPYWIKDLEVRSQLSLGYHVDGILYLALTGREERAMAAQARWQEKRRLRVERVSRQQLKRREPAIDRLVVGGFLFPTEAQVDNVLLMRALSLACRKAGVELREQAHVRGLIVSDAKVHGVEIGHERLRADVVVTCQGSWTSADRLLPVKLPVEPARGQILAFQAPPRLIRHVVMSSRAYMVQRRDGRLITGSTIEFAGFKKALTVEGMHGILCGLRHLSSRVNQCTFLEAWAGLRPYTRDKLPIIGRTQLEGFYAATGHFRHGILLAPITAKIMAELVLEERVSIDLSPFSPQRFTS